MSIYSIGFYTLSERSLKKCTLDISDYIIEYFQISFTICEEKANKQLNNFNEYISGIAAVIIKVTFYLCLCSTQDYNGKILEMTCSYNI